MLRLIIERMWHSRGSHLNMHSCVAFFNFKRNYRLKTVKLFKKNASIGWIISNCDQFLMIIVQQYHLIYFIQVADMRWGVRDEAQDDHKTTELCLREIDNCRRISNGPYFVVSYLIISYINCSINSSIIIFLLFTIFVNT